MTQRDEREKLLNRIEDEWLGTVELYSGPLACDFTIAELTMIAVALRTPADGEAHAEIQRLQEAKRRALAIADERAKENVALLEALDIIASRDITPSTAMSVALMMRRVAAAALSNAPAATPDEGPDPLGYAKGERA